MRTRLIIVFAVSVTLTSGCKTVKDLVSWTPFWWVINRVRFENAGDLRWHAPVQSARNYLDDKRLYFFRIDTGVVKYRVENDEPGDWRELPGGNPHACNGSALKVLLLAADNNRIFVVAEDSAKQRSLWWYCLKRDQAKWASILINAVGDFMRPGYAQWFKCAHTKDNTWINLLALREFVPYIEPHIRRIKNRDGTVQYKYDAFNAPRVSIDVDDIVDIAVGNWTGTVVTYYVLMGSTGKIMYIDEEIVMDRWKEVPNATHRFLNDPDTLTATARIAASNSVIGAYHHAGDSAFVSWIRWDFHNKQDFEYFPLNWCDTAWYRIFCPVKHADFITFDTHASPYSSRDSIWETPEGIDSLYGRLNAILPDGNGNRLKKGDLRGFLGSYAAEKIDAYRMHITVTKGDSVYTIDFNNKERGENMQWTARKVTDSSLN